MTSIRWRSDYALCALYPCNLSAYTAVHLVWPPLGHIACHSLTLRQVYFLISEDGLAKPTLFSYKLRHRVKLKKKLNFYCQLSVFAT